MFLLWQATRGRAVEVTVYLQRLLATPLGTVAFHVPHIQWNAVLATELRLCAVDGYTTHDRHDAFLFLTLVHVEQNLECAS